MIELLQNKYLILGIVLFIIAVIYSLFTNKNKTKDVLETEYDDILNSDKYKVKGQHD
mgnify:CR=1 FL=1